MWFWQYFWSNKYSLDDHKRLLSYDTHLNKYIEAQAMDVIDVSQAKQTGEKTTGQHAHSQVQANGQTLSNYSTEKVVLRMLATKSRQISIWWVSSNSLSKFIQNFDLIICIFLCIKIL